MSRRFNSLMLSFVSLGLAFSSLTTHRVSALDTAPVRNNSGYIGREFNETYDKMFDPFSRAAMVPNYAEDGLWWAITSSSTYVTLTDRTSYLEAHYSSTQLISLDDPIYKVASPSNNTGNYDFLVLTMKGSNGASLSDFAISFRYDDNHSLITRELSQLVTPSQTALPELTSSYQIYVIDLATSLDGLVFEGTPNVEAAKAMVGFHLRAKDTAASGTLGIKEIYWSDNALTTGYSSAEGDYLLDDFQRTDVSKVEEGIWWRGAGPQAEIVGKWLDINASTAQQFYRAAGYNAGDPTGDFDNFVIKLKGLVGGEDISVSPYYNINSVETWGTPILLSALKSADGELLPTVTTKFQNYVISFEENGWDKGAQGFKFTLASGHVHIDEVFFSNLEVDLSAVETEYSLLNPNDVLIFDDFNRESVGATPQYDGNNPVALANNLYYIISYAGIDRFSMSDGSLVFDTTVDTSYMQYTVGGQRVNNGSYEYVVLKVKGTDGASLKNFRMDTINDAGSRSPVVWGNGGLLSGSGLPIPDFDTPNYRYLAEEGYMYVMIDIEASGLSFPVHGFDLFYSGGGKLFIDTIFFANKLPLEDLSRGFIFDNFNREVVADASHWWTDSGQTSIAEGALSLSAPAMEHAWYRTASPVNNGDSQYPFLVIKAKGSEGTTWESVRLETISGTNGNVEKALNSGTIVDPFGQVLKPLSTSYQTFVIDLAKSEFDVNPLGIGVIFGDWASGNLFIDEISFAGYREFVDYSDSFAYDDFDRVEVSDSDKYWVDFGGASIQEGHLVLDASVPSTHTWYRSASPINNAGVQYKYLYLTMHGSEGTTLDTLRIQVIKGSTVIEKAVNSGTVVDAYGKPLGELTTNDKNFVIDLAKSGFMVDGEGIGLIFGDWGTGILHVSEIGFMDQINNPEELSPLVDPYAVQLSLTAPTKYDYEYGETIDLTGMVVTVTLSNGTEKTLSSGQYSVSELDSHDEGMQFIWIGFQDLYKGFFVKVAALPSEIVETGIAITGPTKTNYIVGETIDLTGLSVTLEKSDGSKVTLTTSQYTISGFSSTAEGTYTVTVTYGSFTKTFNVTVEEEEIINPDPENLFDNVGLIATAGAGVLALAAVGYFVLKKKR